MLNLSIEPLNQEAALVMSHWRYEPPYGIYINYPPSPTELAYLLEPTFAYHQILDTSLDERVVLASGW